MALPSRRWEGNVLFAVRPSQSPGSGAAQAVCSHEGSLFNRFPGSLSVLGGG